MRRDSIFWPLSVIVVGGMLVLSSLLEPTRPQASPAATQNAIGTQTAAEGTIQALETLDALPDEEYEGTVSALETAAAASPTPTRQPTATSPSNPNDDTSGSYPYPVEESGTPEESGSPTVRTTGSPTATRTVTTTPTTRPNSTATPTSTGTTAAQAGATATPDPRLSASNLINCVPGETVVLVGSGPPNTAVLAYFGDRAVGGTTIAPNGSYRIPLVIGSERAGLYDVVVRVRSRGPIIDNFVCSVPRLDPTPLPKRN